MGIYDNPVDPFALPTSHRRTEPHKTAETPPDRARDGATEPRGPAVNPKPRQTDAGEVGDEQVHSITTLLEGEPVDEPEVPDGDGVFIQVGEGRRVVDDFRPFFAPATLKALEFRPGVDDQDFETALAAWKVDVEQGSARVVDKPKKPKDLSGVEALPVLACLRLRERVQSNKDAFVSPNAVNKTPIKVEWVEDADRIFRLDKLTTNQVAELIEWSTTDSFWRSNILSMPTLRRQAHRLLMADGFLRWREQNGRVTWSPDATRLLDSMTQVMDLLIPGEAPHVTVPLWGRGAESLLQTYSVLDVEDMMVWALTSRHRGRLDSLLTTNWVAQAIRRDDEFVLWSQQRDRGWARGITVHEKKRSVGGRYVDPHGNDESVIAAAAD